MKVTTRVLTLAVLGAGLVAGVIVLAMWLPSGSDTGARASTPANGPMATPTPITVGFDMNTAGNSCPASTLAVAALIGATSITVADASGMAGGQTILIDAGIPQETKIIGSVVGNVVNVTTALTANHAVGTQVSPQTDCTLGATDTCLEVPTGGGTITIDVFLKDLPVAPEGITGFSGFQYHIGEEHDLPVATVAAITHFTPAINLVAQGFAMQQDFSEPVGTSIPSWDAAVADLGPTEANPPFTKGVLSRLQIDTTGTTPGVYGLTIDQPGTGAGLQLLDGLANDYCNPLLFGGAPNPNYTGCTILDATTTNPQPYGIIAKGVPCPTYADVAVTQTVMATTNDCGDPAPTTMPINTDTNVCVHKILRQNDLASVNVDIDATAVAPANCTANRISGPTTATLLQSTDFIADEIFTLNCSQPSTHGFTFDNDVQPTVASGVIDTNQANNTPSDPLSLAVTATADVEIDSQAFVSPPADITVGVDTTVTLRKHLNIDSGYGPVTVTVTTTRDLPTAPPTCTATLDDQDPVNPVTLPLPIGTDVVVDEDWIINCGAETVAPITFTFHNSIAIATAHVTDPGPGLNTANTDLTVDVVKMVGSVNCNAVWEPVDASLVLQYWAGLITGQNQCPLAPDTLYLPAANVNGDGNVDVIDALFILVCWAGGNPPNPLCPASP